jgi:hypothetical protein
MPVKTKNVHGRRDLHFNSLEEVLADAEKLVASPTTKTLGNWPLDRLIDHLATTMNCAIDGTSFKAPWFIRLVAPLFKRRMLTKKMPAGFNLPKAAETEFYPSTSSAQDALRNLRSAAARLQSEKIAPSHPVFRKLTREECIQLHLRHSELHLSFAIPG